MNRSAPNRRNRTAAALLAVVILLLPPLVRAGAHLRRPSDSPVTFRLNRGFDVPVAKSALIPPDERLFEEAGAVHLVATTLPHHVLLDSVQSCLDQHRQSPDPLRGPPSTLTF